MKQSKKLVKMTDGSTFFLSNVYKKWDFQFLKLEQDIKSHILWLPKTKSNLYMDKKRGRVSSFKDRFLQN
jgi:hypothetical protein